MQDIFPPSAAEWFDPITPNRHGMSGDVPSLCIPTKHLTAWSCARQTCGDFLRPSGTEVMAPRRLRTRNLGADAAAPYRWLDVRSAGLGVMLASGSFKTGLEPRHASRSCVWRGGS